MAERPLNDSFVHTYVPRRDLATIYLFLESQGVRTSSLSDLIRNIIEQFYFVVVNNLGGEPVLSSEDATRILKGAYQKVNLNSGGRHMPAYLKNLQREDLLLGRSPREDLIQQDQFVEATADNVASETEAALAEFRRMIQNESRRTDEENEGGNGEPIGGDPEGA